MLTRSRIFQLACVAVESGDWLTCRNKWLGFSRFVCMLFQQSRLYRVSAGIFKVGICDCVCVFLFLGLQAMSKVRGRRKTKAGIALGSISEAVQEETLRKSLSILQPAADNPASLVGCGGTPTSRKVERVKPVLESKENSPMKPRRSKRKAAVQSSEESKVTSSTPVSNNPKNTDNDGLKQQTLLKYSEKLVPELQENIVQQKKEQKELEHPEASLSGISIPSESSGYFSDNAEKHDSSSKSGTTAENQLAVDNSNKDLEDSTVAEENSPSIPKDVYDLLVSDIVPESYWKDLAENRRLALEEALHENELLRDQLEVLEAEYSRLKQIVGDAEKLAEVVQDIMDE